MQSLVESALPTLLKQHASSLPIHKYVASYRNQCQKEPPLAVLECCKTKYDDFLSPTILKTLHRTERERLKTIDTVLSAFPDDRHRIDALKLLAESEIDAAKLKLYLIEVLGRIPDVFTIQGLATEYKRLIRIYDWLTYGKKEGPSFDGPSKTIHAPTA